MRNTSQNSEWIAYTSGNSVTSLADEGADLWVGTTGGLVQLDKSSGTPTFYNTANSDLPDNQVQAIAIDGSGTK